ncbi:Hypothetical_protein [Hexamita inflata]|uniref:Hypothetical_protein n=1 Tax=Hexamita inflata TaxID=28002 RepID=A0AA86R7N6_9EUKA|nr:Hypothetical protein HINF_LOCUS55224 [Hexamita inflata]
MNEFPQALQLNQFDSNATRLFKLCLYIVNATDLREIIRLCQQIVDILKYVPVKNSVELLYELNFYILHPDYVVKREIAKLLLNIQDFVCAEQQMQIICPLSFVHSPDTSYVQQIVRSNLNRIPVFQNYKFKPTIRLWYYFLQFELQMIGPEQILSELIIQMAGGAEMQSIQKFNVPVNLLRPVQCPKYAVHSSEQFLFSVKLRKLFKDEEDQEFVDGLSELKPEDVFNYFRLQNDSVSVYSTQPADALSLSQSNLQQFVADATSGVVLKYKITINTLDFLIINALHQKELLKTVLYVILQKRAANFKQELSITTYVKFDKRVLLAQKSFEKLRLKFNLDVKALQKVAKSDHKDVVRVGKQELINQTKSIQETEANINAQLDTIKQKINSIQKKMDTANTNVNTIKQQKVVFKEIKIQPEKIEQIKQKAKRTAIDEKIREAFAPSQKDKDKKDQNKEDKEENKEKDEEKKEGENKEKKDNEKETKKDETDKQENIPEKEKKNIKTDIKINKEGAKKKVSVFQKLNQVFTKKDKEEPKETKTVEKEETKTDEKAKEAEIKQKEEEPGMSLDLSAQQVTTTLSLKKEELEKAQEEAKKIANQPEKEQLNKEQNNNDMDLDEPKIEPKVEEPVEQVKQENEIKPANKTEETNKADENNINAQNEQQINAEPAQIITQNKENDEKETEFLLQHDQNAQKEPERKPEEK